MYDPNGNQGPPPSQLNAREAVDLINMLICLHLRRMFTPDSDLITAINEQIELNSRALTDYLLATDPRPGLYFKGPGE
jgi:hypothetical protein